MIVEDEAIIAMETKSCLKMLNYEVVSCVSTGTKAIERVPLDKPDLIVMDIRLKGDLDGIETAKIIRSRFSIPIIFSTAYLDEEKIERAKLTMPFGYVLKPIQERDLKVTIEMALYAARIDAERRNTEKLLLESEEKFRKAFEDSSVGMALMSLKGEYIKVNKALTRILGYSEEEFFKLKNPDITYKGDPTTDGERVRSLMAGEIDGFTTEKRYIHKDGSIIWGEVTVSSVRAANGEIMLMLGQIQNITKRKNAEAELNKTKNDLQRIIDNSMSYISVKDLEGRYTLVSRKFAEEFGIPASEFIGKTDFDFLPKDTARKYREQDLAIIDSGQPITIKDELEWMGKQHQCIINKYPLTNKDGVIYAVCTESLNISDKYNQVK